MAKTVRTLLENALYLSVSDREFSPVEPSGAQINVALNAFHDILDVYRYQVPFWDLRNIENEAELQNLGVSEVNFVHYLIGNVRQTLTELNQADFESQSGVVDLRAIPQYYFFDRQNDRIRAYPLPPLNDARFIIGFKPLNDVDVLDSSIPASIPGFMQAFLRYETAREICDYYNVDWSQSKEGTRQRYYSRLLSNSMNAPRQAIKGRIKRTRRPVPWLSYLSGNTP